MGKYIGWFKFHRKTFDNPVCNKDPEYFYVWCWILANAKYEEGERELFKNEDIILQKGQIITTVKEISKELNLSESKVNRILKKLESEKQIERQTSTKKTLISVINWEQYQSDEKQNEKQVKNKCKTSEKQMTDERKTNEEQMENKRQTDDKPSYYIKKERIEEGKEVKKEKKTTSRKKEPTVYYPNDEQLNQAFIDFTEMRNKIKKPMTDRAVTMAMNKLNKLAGANNDLAIKILEQSVLHCWQDLYEFKDDGFNQKTGSKLLDEWRNA